MFFLKRWYGYILNDWKTVKVYSAEHYRGVPNYYVAFYAIQYSKFFNRYNLHCYGHEPYKHSYYAVMQNYIIQLNQTVTDKIAEVEIEQQIKDILR